MSQVEWSEESEDQPKKKGGIPTWVWLGCGGGCLVLVVAIALTAIFGTRFVQNAMDPEKQWPKVQEVLPFDERPPDIDVVFGMSFPMKQFTMLHKTLGVTATLTQFGSTNKRDYEVMMDPEFKGVFGMARPDDPEAGTMVVQGREVDTLRFSRIVPEPEDTEGIGPGIRLDLTTDESRPIVLELRNRASDQPLSEADVDEFLEPFDVWRGR